ncbi:hypothetical protein, partial [Chromobacterium subtsugae]|uniref:hypothetical protein n=1 Tax=Chromobacterium subtsugae TaxID=251747 RepID=UPI001AD7F34C
ANPVGGLQFQNQPPEHSVASISLVMGVVRNCNFAKGMTLPAVAPLDSIRNHILDLIMSGI